MAALRRILFICAAATGVRVAPTTAAVAPRRQVLAGLAAAAALESSGAAAAEQKTYLVTGASSGIGFAAASELADMNSLHDMRQAPIPHHCAAHCVA